MTTQLSPAMRALLNSAADRPDGRAYNTGQRGFMATHAALIRRGYLAEVDYSAGVITDAGRAAIGRELTAEQVAEQHAAQERTAWKRAEAIELRVIALRHGWQVGPGALVTLTDGTSARVIGRAGGQPYPCRDCGRSHPFPDVVTAQGSVCGVAECRVYPTRDTVVRYLTERADRLADEIAADPGYPANARWSVQVAALRAEAGRLVGSVVDHDGRAIEPGAVVEVVAGPGRHGARGQVLAVELARPADEATEGSVSVAWQVPGWSESGISPHNVRVTDVVGTVDSKGDHRVYDDDGGLTERYVIDRAEHDAHADGLAEQIEAESAEVDEQDEQDEPVPAGWYHRDRDGITVRGDGADDPLVVLFDTGRTWAYTIRELCAELMRAELDAAAEADAAAEVRAVYLRDGDRLLPGRLDQAAVHLGGGLVEVTVWVGGVSLLASVAGMARPAAAGRYRVHAAAHPVSPMLTAQAYEQGRADYVADTIDQAAATDGGTGDYYRRGQSDARSQVVDDDLRAWAMQSRETASGPGLPGR